VGTPAYLAPERTAGEPATPASDLYSLGIVAYECLTGAPPFQGAPMEIAGASRFQPLPPLPPAVPPAVTALVTTLTAKDPADRPGSAGEVAMRAAQLRDAMSGGLVAAPWGRPDALPARPAARSPGRPDGHTAVLLDPHAPVTEMLDRPSAPADGWLPGPQRPSSVQQTRLIARRWPRRRRFGWVAALAVVVALAGWMLASAAGGPGQPLTASTRPVSEPASPASRPATQGPPMVDVNAAALIGRPVDPCATGWPVWACGPR
jgi:hypothetical protein